MFNDAVKYVPYEVGAAERDLNWASKSLSEHNEKWATLQACSSVLHGARALLLAKGYRGRTHFGLKTALQGHYADQGLLAQSYVREFDKAMRLRQSAEYWYRLPHETAATALDAAERFLERVKELLQR